MEFDSQSILELAPHCQFWANEHHPHCQNRVEARVEPAPVGQFAPVDLCAPHVVEWIDDHSFNLGDDWSITPVDDEARGRIQEEIAEPWQDANPGIDPELQVPCEHCGHDKLDHAFFPAADGLYDAPAPYCRAAYKPDDAALIDHTCDCEGYEMFPVSPPWSASH